MAELILHIGSHKTGTSSIQYVLRGSRNALERQGVAYLLPDDRTARNASSLVKVSGEREAFSARFADDKADRLLQPRAPRNIVSAEGFFWFSDPEEVGRFAALARARFERITVLAYLRRQGRLAVSHRNQVRNAAPAMRFYGLRADPLPEYRSYLHRYFDYAAKLVDLWGGAFGRDNVVPVPFERTVLTDGDVVADFAARTGVALAYDAPVIRNASSSGLARMFVDLKLAELGLPPDSRRRIVRRLGREGLFLPTRDEARAFLAHFDASNARLAEHFWIDGRPFAFDSSMEMYPDRSDGVWSHALVGEVIEALLGARDGLPAMAATPQAEAADTGTQVRRKRQRKGEKKSPAGALPRTGAVP